jgi:hypothetical protein
VGAPRTHEVHCQRRSQTQGKVERIFIASPLALVGWYLMVPPSTRGTNLSLSKWSIYQHYNAPDECYWARSNFATGLLQDPPPDFAERFGDNYRSIFARAQCIASDDPRLKEK